MLVAGDLASWPVKLGPTVHADCDCVVRERRRATEESGGQTIGAKAATRGTLRDTKSALFTRQAQGPPPLDVSTEGSEAPYH